MLLIRVVVVVDGRLVRVVVVDASPVWVDELT